MRRSEEAAGRAESEVVGGERGESREREREGEGEGEAKISSRTDSHAIAPSRRVPAGGPCTPALLS